MSVHDRLLGEENRPFSSGNRNVDEVRRGNLNAHYAGMGYGTMQSVSASPTRKSEPCVHRFRSRRQFITPSSHLRSATSLVSLTVNHGLFRA